MGVFKGFGFYNGSNIRTFSSGQSMYAIANDTNVQTGRTFVSYDYGSNWTTIPDIINDFGIDISNNGQYVTILGGSDYRTINGGNSWLPITSSSAPNISSSGLYDYQLIRISPDGKYQIGSYTISYLYPPAGFSLSSDYGATWTTGSSINVVFTISENASYIYGFLNNDLYVSTNQGSSFTQLTGYSLTTYAKGISCSDNGQYVTVVTANKLIKKSSDYGATWTNFSSLTGGNNWQAISMSSSGQYQTAVLDCSVLKVIVRSSNYGASWSQVSLPFTSDATYCFGGVSVSSNGQYQVAGYFLSNGSGVLISSDYGATWTRTQLETNGGSGFPIIYNVAVN
jgi:photosystem II stability/assembly factor-like uncharacterized protein